MIHTREAWDDTFDILDAEGVPARTIFHCFTGGPDEARRCLDRGAYVSFSGIVTFTGAPDVRGGGRARARWTGTLVETDSPYLAPVPHRGQPQPPGLGAARRRPPRRGPRRAASRRSATRRGPPPRSRSASPPI